MKVTHVLVGDVLRLERRAVTVNPLGTYQEIGVRSFGKGIFHKEPIGGAEIGTKRIFRIEPGDLVFSNVFAWEGAVALATDAEQGFVGSHRFMTYVALDPDAVDVRYLRYLFTSEMGLELLCKASPGSAGRNRTLAIDRFESIELPLPDIAEQRQIVRRLDREFAALDGIAQGTLRSVKLDDALIEQSIEEFLVRLRLDGWHDHPLGEVAEINPKPVSRPVDDSVSFVAMAGVNDRTGLIQSFELRAPDEVTSGYKQFKSGDVIFARITPCMQNGKSAVVRDLPTEVGYGSTEFHVIRTSSDVTADWIHRMVRTRSFRERAAARFQGTAGQQRVPESFLEEATIPIPPTPQAEANALVKIDGFLEKGGRLQALRQRSLTLSTATRLSVLNAAFGGGTRVQS
jgi:type I restriction enzyme S subunit